MMNKLFYVLLFLSVSVAGVLWWMMHSAPSLNPYSDENIKGLRIEDDSQSNLSIGDILLKEEAKISLNDEADDAYIPHSTQDSNMDTQMDTETERQEPAVALEPTLLFIASDPAGASVFLDNVEVGKTPFESRLTHKEQVFRFELAGFQSVERKAPAEVAPRGGYLNWLIEMPRKTSSKSSTSQPEAKTAAAKANEEASSSTLDAFTFKGNVGPHFVQVQSIAEDPQGAWAILVQEYRTQLRNSNVFACRVNLGERGRWVRILLGPFSSVSEAQRQLPQVSKQLKMPDAFVTSRQDCL